MEQLQMFGGNWTDEKLEILRQYLNSYNTALKNQSFTRVYIDAFAGTGYRQQKRAKYNILEIFPELHETESEQFLKGSAKLALESNPPFHKYYFVESDPDKITELEKLRTDYPTKREQITIIQGDANRFVQEFCQTQNWRSTRAVLFLDPFATQVEWNSIDAIAKTASIDVWILFPLMAVNRLLSRDPQKVLYECLNRLFGTEQWFEAFYKTKVLDDIFGKSEEKVVKACDFKRIGEFYRDRLKSVFYGVAEKQKIFYNTRGSPLFQLFFAVGNPKGAEIALRIANHLLEAI